MRMVGCEVGVFTTADKGSFSQFGMFFDHLFNNRRQIKASVNTATYHAIHVEICISSGENVYGAQHEDRIQSFPEVRHLYHHTADFRKTVGNQSSRNLFLL